MTPVEVVYGIFAVIAIIGVFVAWYYSRKTSKGKHPSH